MSRRSYSVPVYGVSADGKNKEKFKKGIIS